MTPIQLTHALSDRIREIVKAYALESPVGAELQTPRVWVQGLPERMYEGDPKAEDYPWIQVMLGGGSLFRPGDSYCATALMVGGYEDDPGKQGWMIPAELIWRILTGLAVNPVIGPYKLLFPVDWSLPDPRDQPKPIWVGQVDLHWTLPAPEPVADLENMDLHPPKGAYTELTT